MLNLKAGSEAGVFTDQEYWCYLSEYLNHDIGRDALEAKIREMTADHNDYSSHNEFVGSLLTSCIRESNAFRDKKSVGDKRFRSDNSSLYLEEFVLSENEKHRIEMEYHNKEVEWDLKLPFHSLHSMELLSPVHSKSPIYNFRIPEYEYVLDKFSLYSQKFGLSEEIDEMVPYMVELSLENYIMSLITDTISLMDKRSLMVKTEDGSNVFHLSNDDLCFSNMLHPSLTPHNSSYHICRI